MSTTQQQDAPKYTAADGLAEIFNVPGHPLLVRAVDFNRLHAENETLRMGYAAARLEIESLKSQVAPTQDGIEYVRADRAMRAAHPACKPDMLVNAGALKLALNVLRRAGKDEVADELEKTAQAAPAAVAGQSQTASFEKALSAYLTGDGFIAADDIPNICNDLAQLFARAAQEGKSHDN